MQVEHAWVDEIEWETQGATVSSMRYTFGDARWVSVHAGAAGDRLGPITVIDGDNFIETPTVKRQRFPARNLHVDEAVSFRDLHTLSRATLYLLVLPSGCVAEELSATADGEPAELLLGATAEGRLFVHQIAGYSEVTRWQIATRIRRSPKRAEELARSAEVVRGTSAFDKMRDTVRGAVLSPDLWTSIINSQLSP